MCISLYFAIDFLVFCFLCVLLITVFGWTGKLFVHVSSFVSKDRCDQDEADSLDTLIHWIFFTIL